jgi:hypothetical protein
MKKGFQLEIQKDLTEEEYKSAVEWANDWISTTCKNDLVFHRGGRTGGWKSSSYLRRGIFGFMPFNNNDNDLVFRRISASSRIFGLIKASTMTKPDGTEINLERCKCAKHRGGEKVIWRNNKKPETFIYVMVGDVKG